MDEPLHSTSPTKPLSGPMFPLCTINWPTTLTVVFTAAIVLCRVSYLWPTKAAASIAIVMSAWVGFLIYDYYHKVKFPSLPTALGMICHVIPALALYGTCHLAEHADNRADIWFPALLIFRYWRTLTQIFFWFRYKPLRPGPDDVMKPRDCTVVIPTVGPAGNDVFEDLVASILTNAPARVVFATNSHSAGEAVEEFLRTFRRKYCAGNTAYQQRYGLRGTAIVSEVQTVNVGLSSKRKQIVAGLGHAKTAIVISADDTAEWAPSWLHESLAAFNDPQVGLVGTRKWAKDLPALHTIPGDSILHTAWLRWCARFWNNMGGLYLTRHNFEIQSSTAADGGIFCVSGRSCLIRREMLTASFAHAFTHEYILARGPVEADDDNFLTRWAVAHGWSIAAQCQGPATMSTVLGTYPTPFKFPAQCRRWSRSTVRQNALALLCDRTAWWTWPLTVWTTYIPWLYNAALIWDGLALLAFCRTTLFTTSASPRLLLFGFFCFIQATKLVKTAPWWWAHPLDFCLFFVVPAHSLFVYYHSVVKIYTALTCLNMEWCGRELPAGKERVE